MISISTGLTRNDDHERNHAAALDAYSKAAALFYLDISTILPRSVKRRGGTTVLKGGWGCCTPSILLQSAVDEHGTKGTNIEYDVLLQRHTQGTYL